MSASDYPTNPEFPEDETLDPDLEPPKPRREAAEGVESSPEPDRILVGEAPEDEVEPDEPEHTDLTEEERESFGNLLTVGRRTKTVTVFDHKVVLVSLNVDDEIMIGQATRPYKDSLTHTRAWQSATVAAAIRSVDGEAWGQSLYADAEPEVLFESKWEKVRRMYPLVVQVLYKEVTDMEVEFAELAHKLGKL